MEEAVRWNSKVSREIDLTLRTYLGAQGMRKGDLSKFIEEAVRWRIFNRRHGRAPSHRRSRRSRSPFGAPHQKEGKQSLLP